MERKVYNLAGLQKQKSLLYSASMEYYASSIEPAMSSAPVPIIIDNGSFEFRAVTFDDDELSNRDGLCRILRW